MKIIKKKQEIVKLVKDWKKNSETVAFVPTMGALHHGHISLVEKAKTNCSKVIVSIFVNPIQFDNKTDLEKYPLTLDEDCKKLEAVGVDIVFAPSVKDMYGDTNIKTFVYEDDIANLYCGQYRKGHFQGVLTVVNKLFNICKPDKAFFGLKDYQQYFLIKKMAKDLDLDIEIIPCPLIRDNDGLASSSRNARLNLDQRNAALSINKSLNEAKKLVLNGEQNSLFIKQSILQNISKAGLLLQYVELVESNTLLPSLKAKQGDVILIAAFCGSVRLIDNIEL